MDKNFESQGFIYKKNTMKQSYSKFFLDKIPSNLEISKIDLNF